MTKGGLGPKYSAYALLTKTFQVMFTTSNMATPILHTTSISVFLPKQRKGAGKSLLHDVMRYYYAVVYIVPGNICGGSDISTMKLT
jgi:hypothetical protein